MTEDDLIGSEVREPLRSCLASLADQLWGVAVQSGALGFAATKALQAAALALRCAAASQAAAGGGALDAALAQVACALGATPADAPPPGRLEATEAAIGALQAGSMLAVASGDSSSGGSDQPMRESSLAAPGGGGGEAAGAEAEPMEATAAGEEGDGDEQAAELSAVLRCLASLLQLDAAAPSAAALARACLARARELVARLPPGFYDPLLPAGCLDAEQARRQRFLAPLLPRASSAAQRPPAAGRNLPRRPAPADGHPMRHQLRVAC